MIRTFDETMKETKRLTIQLVGAPVLTPGIFTVPSFRWGAPPNACQVFAAGEFRIGCLPDSVTRIEGCLEAYKSSERTRKQPAYESQPSWERSLMF